MSQGCVDATQRNGTQRYNALNIYRCRSIHEQNKDNKYIKYKFTNNSKYKHHQNHQQSSTTCFYYFENSYNTHVELLQKSPLQPPGFAFVTYKDESLVEKAVATFNGKEQLARTKETGIIGVFGLRWSFGFFDNGIRQFSSTVAYHRINDHMSSIIHRQSYDINPIFQNHPGLTVQSATGGEVKPRPEGAPEKVEVFFIFLQRPITRKIIKNDRQES